MNFYEKKITILDKKEVFIFGSNLIGFHGAGAAAFASFGKSDINWRDLGYDKKSRGWQGMYNIKGVAEGFQIGTHGWSYAIPTVTKPGAKRSIPLKQIENSIKSMYAFAIAQKQWNFFVAQDARVGFNGYKAEEMADAYLCAAIPSNMNFYKPFYDILIQRKP